MKVLVACECSGRVRDAFLNLGHDAYSLDLKPSETPTDRHLKVELRKFIEDTGTDYWDLLIAHPDCTYLAVSGARWWVGRKHLQDDAIKFVKWIASLPVPKIAIENPIGKLSTAWRKPDQIIQPWWFGDAETKATCLWLKNLPLLKATHIKPNVLKHSTWRMPPSEHRKTDRARTFQGIANAMAEQWG
jgi:hypothetical protein